MQIFRNGQVFLALALLAGSSLPGCDDDAPTPEPDAGLDSGTDSGPDSGPVSCGPHEDVSRGTDGLADPGEPVPGKARAGRITDEQDLLPGPKARAKVGDFLLANDRIALVIEDVRDSDGYNPFGGEIADISLYGEDGDLEPGLWGDLLWGAGPRLIQPDSVGVVADGADGGAAIVRVVGRFVDMPLIRELATTLLPIYYDFDGSLDVVLAPDSNEIEMRMHVWNRNDHSETVDLALYSFLMGDGIDAYVPRAGFEADELPSQFRYIGFVGRDLAYGFFLSNDFEFMIKLAGVTILRAPTYAVSACGEQDVEVGRIVVGRSADDLQQVWRRAEGEPAALAIQGRVIGADGEPAVDARVHLVAPGATEHVTMATTGEDGSFTLHAPTGSYDLWAFGDDPGVGPIPVDVGSEDVELLEPVALGERGTLIVRVSDTEGSPVPAKVSISQEGTEPPARMFGEPRQPAGSLQTAYAGPEGVSFRLSAGHYLVSISRGFELELAEVEVDVTADEEVVVDEALDRVVDSANWMSADFHVHSFYSPDSSDGVELKVRAAAAEGLEIPVSTEHEWITDFQPVAEALDLDSFLHGMSGIEITTFRFGHFQAYPATARPGEINNGAFLWYDRSLPEIAADVRQDPAEPVFQVNHPRGISYGSYFTAVGFNSETGEVRDEENWSTDFDAVEVFNNSSFDQNRDGTVRDWFRLIEMGVRPTATGNSDTHYVDRVEIGYPRTYVLLGTDDPQSVSPAAVADAIRTGHAVVSGGAFLTVTSGGAQAVGETLEVEAGVAEALHVTVQAPEWVDLDRLEVIVGGETVQTIELDQGGTLRFDADIEIAVDADGWVIFVASGDEPMDPVSRGDLPFGVTNPVYLDVP